MLRSVVALLFVFVVLALTPQPATARPKYQVAFFEYAEELNDDEDYTKELKKAKCYVCHQGRSKKNHNPYGIHLTELLTKEDMKDEKKALESIKKVGKLHSDAKDESSPTYNEMVKAGKLPGGSLEDAKQEPKDSE